MCAAFTTGLRCICQFAFCFFLFFLFWTWDATACHHHWVRIPCHILCARWVFVGGGLFSILSVSLCSNAFLLPLLFLLLEGVLSFVIGSFGLTGVCVRGVLCFPSRAASRTVRVSSLFPAVSFARLVRPKRDGEEKAPDRTRGADADKQPGAKNKGPPGLFCKGATQKCYGLFGRTILNGV